MNDLPEKIRRRPSEKLRVSSEENMVVHREVEKQRRQGMASLYACLRSLLPLEFTLGKRSTSDQVNGAVNYIEYLQRNIKDMSSKRDHDLMILFRRSFGSSNEKGWNEITSNHVVIRPCLVSVEIVFLAFSKRRSQGFCKCFVTMVSVFLAAFPPM